MYAGDSQEHPLVWGGGGGGLVFDLSDVSAARPIKDTIFVFTNSQLPDGTLKLTSVANL